ncbi:MAG: YceD family protein [Lacisediminihabitans sp.]
MQHTNKTPYTVDVYDLMHRPGEMRERVLEVTVPEGFGNAIVGVKEGSRLQVDLRMESLHDGILVTAEVDGTAVGECGRCLIDIELPVQVEIQELFAYSQTEAFEYEVQSETIDLEPVIRDAVVLSLPFQPVCQEDCLGLCPQCGARLLDNPGHEHEAPVDPRWAALAGLDGPTGISGVSQEDVAGPSSGATEEKR